ncbi:nuclear transport factor 2 family protein [Aquimarina longa]|uniref:nuclear transport factor 2 family protein n=1 Tax=Aquimarina longa TaxID=1080221 RepID=UPI00078517BE|nr:nuclear transport factor 2 family protein [Aquimarina longa]
MKHLFFIVFSLLCFIGISQNNNNANFIEKKLVTKTIKKYINGSSYNKLDVLEQVFAKEATLYLTIKGDLKIITPKEYVAFFKGEYGQSNGRIGKILSTVIHHDIATATVEILIPDRKLKFIDIFLLRKIENEWKIISKTATMQHL